MNKSRALGLCVAASCLWVAATATTATAALDKCQKAVSKETAKLEAKMVKTLNKCGDLFQKAEAKGDPLSSITSKCNDALGKVFDIGNGSSAIAKAKAKLADLSVKGKCDDSDLATLGHLSEAVFGDKWQRLVLISAWKSAYENALSANAALVDIFQQMSDAGGCSLCSLLTAPPCHAHSCILGAGSGGPVNITSGTLLTTNLTGAVPVSACDVPSVFSPGEFAILGGPNRGINPVLNVLPNVHVCVTGFRTSGYVNCIGAAGNPRIDTDICVDHIVEDIGGLIADECETNAPGEVCQPDAEDTDHTQAANEDNGGACLNLTTNPAVAGDAFFLATTRIQVIVQIPGGTVGEEGPDDLPCTADDMPASITVPATIPQTTGQATARVIDPNNNDALADVTVGPVTGVAFPSCAALESSDLSGGETVSAAAALHGLPGPLDSAFSTRLVCQ